jgi:hypothetical protein
MFTVPLHTLIRAQRSSPRSCSASKRIIRLCNGDKIEAIVSGDMKNIFISHVREDDGVMQNLKLLLDRNGYTVGDSSIHSEQPNQATSEAYSKSGILAPRIR